MDDPWGAGLLGPGGDLSARLERWAAEARVDEAARQRTRERWLLQQAEEGGRFTGVLCDLAERGTAVALRTRAGRQHRGRVRAVGDDFVAVDPGSSGSSDGTGGTDGSGAVFVALAAVSSVRVMPGSATAPTGDRAVRTGLRLAEVLAGLAAERERVRIVARDGGDAIAGSLRSVGLDVAVVRLDGRDPATVYVPIPAITELTLPGELGRTDYPD
jgi:hypothetical protein